MKIIKTLLLLIPAILLPCLTVLGQDHVYTKFFESPVYLNPALTGQFEGDLRMNMIHRSQWTSLPGNLNYTTAAIDYNMPQFGGGVGLMFNRSSEGTAFLNKNAIAATYAYSVGSEGFVLSFGLQVGVTNRSINRDKLVFYDQLDPRIGYIPGSVSAAEQLLFDNKFYFDSGAGLNLVIGEFNIGGAVQHINKPNESFTGAPAKLPMRSVGHISYRWDLTEGQNLYDDEKMYIIPSVVYNKQATAQSLSAGVQFKRGMLNAGVWYHSGGQVGPSSVGFSLVFDLRINGSNTERMRLGVSHDMPVSGLNYSNTSGITEANIGYQTPLPSREAYYRFEGLRRCYDFY